MSQTNDEAVETKPQPENGDEATAPVEIPVETVDPLAQAQAEAAKWKDVAARNQAELENYRKRVARDRDADILRAKSDVLEDMLPVLDNFDLGMIEVRKGDPKSPLVIGLEMIERQLKEFSAGAGLMVIDAVGSKFDPNLHEAVSQEESAEVPEGHVVRQLRKGFKFRDRLIRPAMVVVSKGRPA